MLIAIIIALILIILGVGAVVFLRSQSSSLGSVAQNRIYQDSAGTPGEILYATSVNLCGKPDYVIHTKDGIIPIEVKTGKTPDYPYENHIMQLMAYCLLVDEHYKTRPPGGIIRYQQTGKEFKIAYTKEAEDAIRKVVKEISEKRARGDEPTCNHPEHNS
jgi:CRISPR-associated exonuclease Cas4